MFSILTTYAAADPKVCNFLVADAPTVRDDKAFQIDQIRFQPEQMAHTFLVSWAHTWLTAIRKP